jgi:uncharacterized membrane protein
VFLSYVLSFVHLGIYWSNHHHLLQTVRHVNGPILWANLHLLFWLTLVPVVTAWMGDAVAIPVALVEPGLACALYVAVAVIWLVPDRRIEKILGEREPA